MNRYYFLEQVVTGGTQRKGYSLPDAFEENETRALINAIESNKNLNAMVFGDDVYLPGASKATAKDVWTELGKTDIGQALIKKYPQYTGYRISSVMTSGDAFKPGEYNPQRTSPDGKPDPKYTREIDLYDVWANDKGRQLSGSMPSFKEFMQNPSKWRPNEVSGMFTKQSPVETNRK
jgi:hypothetical protein